MSAPPAPASPRDAVPPDSVPSSVAPPSVAPRLLRIAVVGCSGAGKTSFARALAARLGAPHVEIDALYHGPNWQTTPREVVRARVTELIAGETWVFDGNYGSTCGDLVRSAADTVLWLDFSRSVVMRSIVARTVGRVTRGTVLWNGNRERWWNMLDPRPKQNIVLWAWTQFGAYRSGYERESAAAPAGRTWLRFPTRDAAWEWLESVPRRGAAGDGSAAGPRDVMPR